MCYVKCMCMHEHPIQLPKQGDENVATVIIICKRGNEDYHAGIYTLAVRRH